MMRRNFRSLIVDLIRPLGYALSAESTEEEISALSLRLQILRSAPEPKLADARKRVMAEAALLEKWQVHSGDSTRDRQPRLGFAMGVLMVVLCVAIIALAAPKWNHASPANPLFGFFWTPALTRTTAPVTFSTGTIAATPDSNPPRIRMELVLTAVPGRMPRPAPVIEPTPSPFLTLTRTSQELRTY